MMRSWGSSTGRSALATGELAAIRSAGFLTVGRVTGAAGCANPITEDRCPGTWSSHAVSARGYGTAQADVSSVGGSPDGTLATVVREMDQVRREAIDRMAAECAALSGHGVVGVRLTAVTSVDLAARARECPKSRGRDRIAQATVAGTAITRFALPAQPAGLAGLTIMPLGDRRPGAPSGSNARRSPG